MTQPLHVPVTKKISERDIAKPMSSERERAAYLEGQVQHMGSVQLPMNIPSMDEESHTSTNLTRRIHVFCKE